MPRTHSSREEKDSPATLRLKHTVPVRKQSLTVVVTAACVVAVVMVISFGRAKAAPASTHGLTGRYFVSGPQVAMKPNDFLLPEPVTAPAATRVDAQIAFGQGSGF